MKCEHCGGIGSVKITSADGASAWINPDQVAAVVPIRDKSGAIVVGRAAVVLAGQALPPIVLGEGPEAAAARVFGK